MFHLAVPCILIKLVLSFLTHENQSDKSDKVELLAKRIIRQQVAVLGGIQEQHVQQLLAIIELRLLLMRLTTTQPDSGRGSLDPRDDPVASIRDALARLRSVQSAEQERDFTELTARAERLFRLRAQPRRSNEPDREFESLLEHSLERIKSHLAEHLQEELERV